MHVLAATLVVWAVATGIASPAPQWQHNPGKETQAAAQQTQYQGFALDERPGSRQREHETDKFRGDDDTWMGVDAANAVLTLILVFFAGIAVALTVKLERPWLVPHLSPENIEAICDMLKEPPCDWDGILMPSLHLSIANHGRVPGWMIERCILFKVLPEPLKPEPAYTEVEQTGLVAIPDDKPVRQLSRVLFFTRRTIENIRSGESCAVCYGYIKYRGLFRRWGKIRETRFCWASNRRTLEGTGARSYAGDTLIHQEPPHVVVRFDIGGPPDWNRYT